MEIQKNHQAIKTIYEKCYSLSYQIIEDDEFSKEIVIRAFNNKEQIGEAEFIIESGPTGQSECAHCQNIDIDEGHRQKGIGTAIYVYAERVLGKKLCNFWGDDPKQSPGAKALWAQKNRPFGN